MLLSAAIAGKIRRYRFNGRTARQIRALDS